MERQTDGEEKYGESDFINSNACKQKFLDLKNETIWTWGASHFKSNISCKNIHRLCNCSLDHKIITFFINMYTMESFLIITISYPTVFLNCS